MHNTLDLAGGHPPSKSSPDFGGDQLRAASANLEKLIQHQPSELAASLDLDTTRGPYLLNESCPTGDGWQLAFQLTKRLAIPAIEKFVTATPITNFQGWEISSQGTFDPATARLGVPLIGAFSETAIGDLVRIRLAERLAVQTSRNPFKALRKQLRYRLSGFILLEQQLWEIAATTAGSPLPFEIPYACRFALLEWLWSPQVHRQQKTPTVCIRCGTFFQRRVSLENPNQRGPRCAKCARETIKERQWPTHAIAPAGPGTWWLHCQRAGCSNPARGDRRTLYCDRHKMRRQSSGRRATNSFPFPGTFQERSPTH